MNFKSFVLVFDFERNRLRTVLFLGKETTLHKLLPDPLHLRNFTLRTKDKIECLLKVSLTLFLHKNFRINSKIIELESLDY